MADETVTLELLSRQQRRILDEMQLLRADVKELRQDNLPIRDDIKVLSAMAIRQDHATKALLDDMRILHTQIGRMNDPSASWKRLNNENPRFQPHCQAASAPKE